MLLLAFGAYVRLHGPSDALVSFNNTRQLHCAIITRALYFEWTRDAGDPRRIVAERASERRGKLEPPIVEHLVALGYTLTGGEHFWIVRWLGTAFWLGGAALLYAFARLLLSPVAGLVAAAYFVFVPFGVVASQSFQPDPLMMLLVLASFERIARNDRSPQLRTALVAGAISGIAVLVKPVCGPVLVLLYAALALRRLGFLGALRALETWSVAALLLIPSALYYGSEITGGGRLRSQAAGSFMPEYWHRPEFWPGWRDLATSVAGGSYVLATAIAGVVLAPAGRARVALWALVAGYVAFGFAFPYHIHTHDYYHLQLLPIAGVALAALFQRCYSAAPSFAKPGVALATAACALVVLTHTVRAIQAEVWPRTHREADRDARYLAIGQLVGHSNRVVFIDPNKYGSELEFDGEITGWRWPAYTDLRRARRRGRPPLDWEAKLHERLSQGAEFFVITPADELGKQRELRKYLESHHPRISDAAEYIVFDLRRRL